MAVCAKKRTPLGRGTPTSPPQSDHSLTSSGGGQPSVLGVEMTTTRPSGNSWLYQAKNNTATDQTITAYALCLVQ